MKYKRISISAVIVLVLLASWLIQREARSLESEKIIFKDSIVAGGPKHFMEVQHVVLKGTNFDIGKKLGEIARKENIELIKPSSPFNTRIRRSYFMKSYPSHFERMKGIAEAYGKKIDDDSFDFSALPQSHMNFGCSSVFFPGKFTENGHGILSRNFDFTTGTMQGKKPQGNERPVLLRPFIFEIYPDRGYPSLFVCAFDLAGGVLDGINSEGLTVAVLAEEESTEKTGGEPSLEDEVGLHELLVMRYLLDNCKNVEEAKEALLSLKQYYAFAPLHYIIADRHGRSFVFEFSPARNRSLIIDGEGPQCITNHLVSRYKSIEELPGKDEPKGSHNSFHRYRVLSETIRSKDKFSLEEIGSIIDGVAVSAKPFVHPVYAPARTIWRSIYDAESRTLEIDFYLGEELLADNKDFVHIKRSGALKFQLR